MNINIHWILGAAEVVLSIEIVRDEFFKFRQSFLLELLHRFLFFVLSEHCFGEIRSQFVESLHLKLHLSALERGREIAWLSHMWPQAQTLGCRCKITAKVSNNCRLIDHCSIRRFEKRHKTIINL